MKVISASAPLPSPAGLLLLLPLLGPIMLSCSLAAEIRPIFHQLRRLTVHTEPHTPTAPHNMAAGHDATTSHYIKVCRLVTLFSKSPSFAYILQYP